MSTLPRATACALSAVALLTLPAAGIGAERTQLGTPMSLTPAAGSEAFGCETRWQAGIAPPFVYERQPTGLTTCTAWQAGQTANDTFLVPGPGTVTRVRVRSGPNPAPLRVTIIKRLFQKNPNPPNQITDAICCTGTGRESATFQPQPNAVTEVAVNLPVTTTDSINGASGHWDIVALTAMGPGELPIASTGPHSLSVFNAPTTTVFYPKVETGLQGQAEHNFTNYVVLMNFDWTDAPAAAPGPAPGAAPAPPPAPAPLPTTPAAALRPSAIAFPSARRCVRPGSRLLVQMRPPAGLALAGSTARVGRRTVATATGARPLRVTAPRRGALPLRVALRAATGATVSAARTFRVCAPR
jgi:hypothetical protein